MCIRDRLLNNYMQICFKKERPADSEEVASLARAIAIWGRIRAGEF